MGQIEALTTPECQEGVQSPGGKQEGEHRGSQLCHYIAGCAIHAITVTIQNTFSYFLVVEIYESP